MAKNIVSFHLQNPTYNRFDDGREQDDTNNLANCSFWQRIRSKRSIQVLVGFSIAILASILLGAIISVAMRNDEAQSVDVPAPDIKQEDNPLRKCDNPYRLHRFLMRIRDSNSTKKKNYTDIYEVDDVGDSLLHWAAALGELSCVKLIHEMDVKNTLINQKGLGGRTPLIEAAESGHLEIVKYLLKNGADLESRTEKPSAAPGSTALIEACKEGHFSVTKLLIEKGANLFAETKVVYQTIKSMDCTFYAAMNGHLKTLVYILGLDNYQGSQKRLKGMALLGAASGGNMRELEYLLQIDTDIEAAAAPFFPKTTPLLITCAKNYTIPTYYLLSRGANHLANDRNGNDCAMYAVERGNIGTLKILNEKDPMIWKRQYSSQFSTSLLFEAIKSNQTDIIELAIEKGADVNQTNELGKTPLAYAAMAGDMKLAKLLISHGAKNYLTGLKASSKYYQQPAVLWAKSFGHLDVYCYLLREIHSKYTFENKKLASLLEADCK